MLTLDTEKVKINIKEMKKMIERLHEMFDDGKHSDFVLLDDIVKYEITLILKN